MPFVQKRRASLSLRFGALWDSRRGNRLSQLFHAVCGSGWHFEKNVIQ